MLWWMYAYLMNMHIAKKRLTLKNIWYKFRTGHALLNKSLLLFQIISAKRSHILGNIKSLDEITSYCCLKYIRSDSKWEVVWVWFATATALFTIFHPRNLGGDWQVTFIVVSFLQLLYLCNETSLQPSMLLYMFNNQFNTLNHLHVPNLPCYL